MSHKKSLCTCGNFPHGIRIDETRSRSTGQLPRVCNERLLHLPNCELQPPGNTSLQRLNSLLPARHMLQRIQNEGNKYAHCYVVTEVGESRLQVAPGFGKQRRIRASVSAANPSFKMTSLW